MVGRMTAGYFSSQVMAVSPQAGSLMAGMVYSAKKTLVNMGSSQAERTFSRDGAEALQNPLTPSRG